MSQIMPLNYQNYNINTLYIATNYRTWLHKLSMCVQKMIDVIEIIKNI